MKKKLEKFKPYLIPTISAGFWIVVILLSCIFIRPKSQWFIELYKPPFYAPQFILLLIGIFVYTVLIAATFLFTAKTKSKKAFIYIAVNGILNILWCLFFFMLHSSLSGIFILLLIFISAIALLKMYWAVKPLSAYLLIPYLLWLGYLIALNYSILMIN